VLPWSWWKFTWNWLFRGRASRAASGKALSQNSIRTAILALSIGIAALSLTLSVFTGFQKLLSERVLSTFGHLRIDVEWQSFAAIEDYLKAEKIPALLNHEEFWGAQAIASGPKAGRGLFIEVRRRGPEPQKTQKEGAVAVKMSRILADYLGVNLGGSFQVLIPGLIQKSLPAELVAFDDIGVYEWDSRRLIVDEPSLRKLIASDFPDIFRRRAGDAHSMRLFLDTKKFPYDSEEALARLQSEIEDKTQQHFKNPFVRVHNWFEQKRNLLTGVAFDKQLLTLIMALLTLVAALNVATSLLVLYFERDKQMAVIRAMGMSPRQMRAWLTLQGLFIGLAASTLGMLMSAVLAVLLPHLPWLKLPEQIYNIQRLPLHFSLGEQLGVFAFGVGSAALVAFLLSLVLSRMAVLGVLNHRR
jgi:lipoprotein-releasing system permease protein